MELFNTKKGQVGGISSRARGAINSIVGIVVLLILFANLIPEANTAGDNLSSTGAPLSNLFQANGFFVVLIMVGLLLSIIALALPGGGRRG